LKHPATLDERLINQAGRFVESVSNRLSPVPAIGELSNALKLFEPASAVNNPLALEWNEAIGSTPALGFRFAGHHQAAPPAGQF